MEKGTSNSEYEHNSAPQFAVEHGFKFNAIVKQQSGKTPATPNKMD